MADEKKTPDEIPWPPPKEELDPELRPFLEEGHDGQWAMLRHPLVYAIPYIPELNYNHNRLFRSKQKLLVEAAEKRDFQALVWHHERPYRLMAFMDYVAKSPLCDDATYWKLLGDIWSDCENVNQNLKIWVQMLMSPRPGREKFMDEADLTVLAGLPEEVLVYRGYKEGWNKDGISFSLSREKAEWFANRFNHLGVGKVWERKVKKSEIFAYLGGRQEQEVLILPKGKIWSKT